MHIVKNIVQLLKSVVHVYNNMQKEKQEFTLTKDLKKIETD